VTKGPSPEELRGALDKTLADVLAPQLNVLLVGINPGVYSAAIGHHFGRPGNRFWKTLAGAGFTPRVLDPREDRALTRYGLGITNLVARTTARADELSPTELRGGARALAGKVARFAPAVVAILGVTAFRAAFARPRAALGRQPETLAGAHVWVLPNPSGLNAHHQLPDLIDRFAELRAFACGLSDAGTRTAEAAESG
jgi:TDG/mug DNA glycosylase family protein